MALDGEVCAKLPATFAVAGEALRVVTPREFVDIDDAEPERGLSGGTMAGSESASHRLFILTAYSQKESARNEYAPRSAPT